MSESLSTDPYKGVRDFYPADWASLQAIFMRVRKVLAEYGYEEYSASPLERAEIYEAKTSDEIVNEQTYTFTDRGDRRVTLRPEMTPTLARMVAGKRRELAFPLRWFSIPNVFRYERPQKGRLREHYQLNVDLVGNINQSQADLEILEVSSVVLKAFGAKDTDFIIRINDRTLLYEACTEAHIHGDAVMRYLRLLDKKSKMTTEEFEIARNSISSVDPIAIIEKAPESSRIHTIVSNLNLYKKRLAQRGVKNVEIDYSLTRGFDYYTGMVFEVFDTNPSNPRSLFGGGRYDGLVALFGADPVMAVGFGMGDVTLSDFLQTHGLEIQTKGSPKLYAATPPGNTISDSSTILKDLRNQGVNIFANLSDKSVGDQLRDAIRRHIPYFTVVGPEEMSSGRLRIKKLETEEETVLEIGQVASFLSS